MPGDEWILVAEAARSVRIADACALINWAWRRKLIPIRGVSIGGGELVDIFANEGDRIDCRRSRVVTGRLFTTYRYVITTRSDLERLAQVRAPPAQPLSAATMPVTEAPSPRSASSAANTIVVAAPSDEAETPASPPAEQSPENGSSAPDQAEPEAPMDEASALVTAVASELSRLFPDGRPPMGLKELGRRVRESAGEKLGQFGLTTLSRSIRLLRWSRQRTKLPLSPPDCA
jgi:hypothetical protein